jgi:hypothetical protein
VWTTTVGSIQDVNTARLITDASDDDNGRDDGYGHGHSSISVMAATPNNGTGIAGINWGSRVLVSDMFGDVTTNNSYAWIQSTIREAVNLARANGQRVVFQGSFQGEGGLTHGGSQADLEKLLRDNADIAVFSIAAGNGGIDINRSMPFDASDPNDPVLQGFSGGVARLAGTHFNVLAVGAMQRDGIMVNGLANASNVFRAGYSNFGSALSLMGPTNSPATDFFGDTVFGGTSCASPNLAGISSLVWSVNPLLSGSTVRQVLLDTAMDMGTPGRDDMMGHGLVHADAAVRRASALMRDSEVALVVPHGFPVSAVQSSGTNQSPGSSPLPQPARAASTAPAKLATGQVLDGASAVPQRLAQTAPAATKTSSWIGTDLTSAGRNDPTHRETSPVRTDVIDRLFDRAAELAELPESGNHNHDGTGDRRTGGDAKSDLSSIYAEAWTDSVFGHDWLRDRR